MASDKIVLSGLQCRARVGVSEQERAEAQTLWLDIELEADLSRASVSDELPPAVDAAKACDLVAKLAEEKPRRLVETLASEAADLLLYAFPLLDAARVRVYKKAAVPALERAGAEIYRRR